MKTIAYVDKARPDIYNVYMPFEHMNRFDRIRKVLNDFKNTGNIAFYYVNVNKFGYFKTKRLIKNVGY